MNYRKIYQSLIDKGKNRKLDCYKEKHHILPRCLGGTDDASNLVDLTPEEHYIAHQLLVKIYPNNVKIIRAATMMVANRPTNKLYGWIKKRFAEAQSVAYKGEGNSQYDTKWVYHDLFGPKKVKFDLIEDYINQGWILGRKYKKPIIKKPRVYIDLNKREKDIEMYREYYRIYSVHGFQKFVELTGYKFSQANLVQRFALFLPEFKPQNGKKR